MWSTHSLIPILADVNPLFDNALSSVLSASAISGIQNRNKERHYHDNEVYLPYANGVKMTMSERWVDFMFHFILL